jgi:hypothetical protein
MHTVRAPLANLNLGPPAPREQGPATGCSPGTAQWQATVTGLASLLLLVGLLLLAAPLLPLLLLLLLLLPRRLLADGGWCSPCGYGWPAHTHTVSSQQVASRHTPCWRHHAVTETFLLLSHVGKHQRCAAGGRRGLL